ncbi:hypothetical protein ABZX85_17670 [Streptomyces sp. NPDC004539]|uniref:hypothetical protein n=1 Tax=Streptomyces sp. NPDC004539 TaxID=3154280 RepID=UPI0033AADD3C
MSRTKYGFAAPPDALRDLRELPHPVRDLALLQLQTLVHGDLGATRLQGALEGFHKVYVGPELPYRMVVQFRDAPPGSAYPREVFLVTAGPRQRYVVYRDTQLRLGRHNPVDEPYPDPADLAHARSPHALRAMNNASGTAPQHPTAPPSAVPPRKAAL